MWPVSPLSWISTIKVTLTPLLFYFLYYANVKGKLVLRKVFLLAKKKKESYSRIRYKATMFLSRLFFCAFFGLEDFCFPVLPPSFYRTILWNRLSGVLPWLVVWKRDVQKWGLKCFEILVIYITLKFCKVRLQGKVPCLRIFFWAWKNDTLSIFQLFMDSPILFFTTV